MIPDTSSRLSVMAVMLTLQASIIGIEILYFTTKSNRTKSPGQATPLWQRVLMPFMPKLEMIKGKFLPSITRWKIRQSVTPVIAAVIGIIFVAITFGGESRDTFRRREQCDTNLDADISGDGVRMSIWAQEVVLVLISVLGLFHNNDTSIKEVCGGLILTHASLVIALFVQMGRRSLTSVDAAIGSIIVDAQNIALQMPLAAKETLAARWQVLLLVPTQIIGLIALPIFIVRLTHGDFAADDCNCFYVFWWSWISDCSAYPSRELSVFWMYYALRWFTFLQSSFHSLYNTRSFHWAEKSKRECGSEGRSRSRIERVEKNTITDNGAYTYDEFPATVSLTYTLHGLFALTSMAIAELSIRDTNLRTSSQIWYAVFILVSQSSMRSY